MANAWFDWNALDAAETACRAALAAEEQGGYDGPDRCCPRHGALAAEAAEAAEQQVVCSAPVGAAVAAATPAPQALRTLGDDAAVGASGAAESKRVAVVARLLSGRDLASAALRPPETLRALFEAVSAAKPLCSFGLAFQGRTLSAEETVEAAGLTDGAVVRVILMPSPKVLTACADGTSRLFDASTGVCQRYFLGNERGAEVSSVAFSPDGDTVVIASIDGSLRVIGAVAEECKLSLPAGEEGVQMVAFSSDGRSILLASTGGVARLLDAATGNCERTYTGHTGAVLSVTFSPCGAKIATSSRDNTAKLFDGATATCELCLATQAN
eukprot:TRINITY_DN28053_c0_g4_i2.p1 TRINITY_DN28053_c0_g4~~TRINITY_DN28053_c0_g4_i2.p1  ORF type:complete len:344 (+),score=78.68 TRINITY_DN28053_c0_g4_i2:52-1032(+)